MRGGNTIDNVTRGRRGEAVAAAYLELAGYRVRRRNVRFGPREVDLVATQGRLLVFVEVKLRAGLTSQDTAVAVNRIKRLDLLRATGPLLGRLQAAGWRVRYDVIAVGLAPGRGELTLRHYRGVFSPPSSFVT